MTSARQKPTATLLRDGRVLIAGGLNNGEVLDTAELFDPATGKFTATTGLMTSGRWRHTATLLQDGRVLIVGGEDQDGVPADTSELFDPDTGKFLRVRVHGLSALRPHGHAHGGRPGSGGGRLLPPQGQRSTRLSRTVRSYLMLRTVLDAIATACRAASLQEWELVPTISRTIITPISLLTHARRRPPGRAV